MTHSDSFEATGTCLCGGVTFAGRIPDDAVTACHCGQCRRWSGHVWASFHLEEPQVSGDSLRWYASSDQAERGFCATCGSSLFWRPKGRRTLSVSPGALDNPTQLRLRGHIFTADKGDYYALTDDLPSQEQ